MAAKRRGSKTCVALAPPCRLQCHCCGDSKICGLPPRADRQRHPAAPRMLHVATSLAKAPAEAIRNVPQHRDAISLRKSPTIRVRPPPKAFSVHFERPSCSKGALEPLDVSRYNSPWCACVPQASTRGVSVSRACRPGPTGNKRNLGCKLKHGLSCCVEEHWPSSKTHKARQIYTEMELACVQSTEQLCIKPERQHDPHYRYKMPPVESSPDNRSKQRKTHLQHWERRSKHLPSEAWLVKYMAACLSTDSCISTAAGEGAYLTGHHSCSATATGLRLHQGVRAVQVRQPRDVTSGGGQEAAQGLQAELPFVREGRQGRRTGREDAQPLRCASYAARAVPNGSRGLEQRGGRRD